jgi:hypothetical protein
MQRTVPAASGHIFGIPVEVHVQGPLGRAAVALHELHDIAESHVGETGDTMGAVAHAADLLIGRLASEGFDDVSVAVGMTISPSARLSGSVRGPATTPVQVAIRSDETVLALRRGPDCITVATSSFGPNTDVATASKSSALESLRAARLALGGHRGNDEGDALVVSQSGAIRRAAV